MFINFADIPGHQNLFLDYLYEFENVERFYETDFRNIDAYKSVFQKIAGRKRAHAEQLNALIKKGYGELTPSKQTLSNIESLSASNTIAVVTGQQLGVLGGPMYTFYKIITAIKLCSKLKDKYEEYKFVPVFWMEGDDHDFDEVRELKLIDKTNSLKKIYYNDGLEEETNRGSVAEIKFNDNINTFFDELSDALRDTEFKEGLLNKLKNFYKPGNTFQKAMFNLLFEYFDDSGLVLFNPADPEVKKLLKPVFKEEIENYRKHSEHVITVSAELEEVYHAQIKLKPINLFVSEESGRYSLEPVEDEYRLKGKRKKFTKDELLALLEENPSSFSANVLLRPICQDYLLPTGLYIGGPSEVSYFAQIIPMYKEFDIPVPVIYPRSSITIVEGTVKKTLEKYNLYITDFFKDEHDLNEKLIGLLSDVEMEPVFKKARTKIEELFDEVKSLIKDLDPTLEDTTDKTLGRVNQSIDQLYDKAQKANERKHETVLRQADKVRTLIFPEASLQEREINFVYFAHKYGEDILKWIFDQLSINKFEHQMLEM